MGTLDAALAEAGPTSAPSNSGTLSDALAAANAPSEPTKTDKTKSQDFWAPEKSALDAAGGVLETVGNAALGGIGALGGGLAEVGGLLTGSTDRAQRWNDWARRNISTVAGLYDPTPQTETGKGIQDVINTGFRKIEQAGGWSGEKTLGTTGSPLAATIADTGTQALLQTAAAVIGAKGLKYVGGGIFGSPEAGETSLDQGGREVSEPASSELVAQRQVKGGGAAVASGNPYPELTGQKSVRNGDFPQLQASQISGDVPLPEQAVRSNIAGQILGDTNERLRPGVVTGNEDTLRTEAALAKSSNPTPQGILLRDKMAEEQRSLQNFADSTISKTGASQTLLNDAQRGDLLNSTLYGPDSLRAYLDSEKDGIYKEAAQRQGPNAVGLNSFEVQVNNPMLASSLKIAGQPNFLPGVQELYQQFKTTGFQNPVTGEYIHPNTVGAAMELHKALNQAWTQDNTMYIGRLKKSILDDTARAGGVDLYQKANQIHAAEQNLFGAPGIKKIFGDTDPNTGISKGLSSEKILPSINNLPYDQYTHIYNVFDSMSRGHVPGAPGVSLPPELQMAGAQAKAEMAGSLVRDVSKAGGDKIGSWNANAANKTLNAYSQKLNLAADPEVVQDLHTLNIGGQIMPNMHSYEGAAQQARRLDQAGLLEKHLPQIGATLGGLTPVPGGVWAGGKAGEWIQAKKAAARQLGQAAQTDAAMEAAAKLGKK